MTCQRCEGRTTSKPSLTDFENALRRAATDARAVITVAVAPAGGVIFAMSGVDFQPIVAEAPSFEAVLVTLAAAREATAAELAGEGDAVALRKAPGDRGDVQ